MKLTEAATLAIVTVVGTVVATAAARATNSVAGYFPVTLLQKASGSITSPEAFGLNGRHARSIRRRHKKGLIYILLELPLEEGKEDLMEKQIYTVGERADKLCAVCNEERGHVVASITIRGQISRVSCPKCGTLSTFKRSTRTILRLPIHPSAPYDRTHTYRTGQAMTHPTYGHGEVTALVEPQKIDVLFSDRVRRLIHARGL